MRRFATLLLALAGCTASQHVQLPQAGLELDLPRGWEVQRAEGQTLLFARPLENGTEVPGAYLMLVRHPRRQSGNGAGLDSYVEFSEQQARQFALGYELRESSELQVAAQPARQQLRRWKGYTRERQEWAVMWVAGSYGYQLTGVAAEKDFERLRSRFENVAASIRAGTG